MSKIKIHAIAIIIPLMWLSLAQMVSAFGSSEIEVGVFEKRVNNSNLPIFTSTCKYMKNSRGGHDYDYLMLMYFGEEGWLLLKDKSGRIISVATTIFKKMTPFSWDFGGGMWAMTIFDLNLKSLQAQKFQYKEKIDFDTIFNNKGLECKFQ